MAGPGAQESATPALRRSRGRRLWLRATLRSTILGVPTIPRALVHDYVRGTERMGLVRSGSKGGGRMSAAGSDRHGSEVARDLMP